MGPVLLLGPHHSGGMRSVPNSSSLDHTSDLNFDSRLRLDAIVDLRSLFCSASFYPDFKRYSLSPGANGWERDDCKGASTSRTKTAKGMKHCTFQHFQAPAPAVTVNPDAPHTSPMV